jgi:VWFA-related protein
MIRRYLLALSLVAQMICGATAQQTGTSTVAPPPPPQKPDNTDVVRITTNLVQVDAIITDKNGKAVSDLKPEEVQIFQDGKVQKITNFRYSSAGSALAEPPRVEPNNKTEEPKAPNAPPQRLTRDDVRRSIALVIDDLGMSFESITYVRRALNKFIDEQMQPGDLVAIVRTNGGTGALQRFTADKRQLHAAVDRTRYVLMGRADTSAFKPVGSPELKIPGEQESRLQTAENFRDELYSVGTLGALRYVVQGLRDMPGRKSALLLSDDLKIFNPGDTARTNQVQLALESLTDFANRSAVAIYTMDARGATPIGLQAQDNLQVSAPLGHPTMGGPSGVSRGFREMDALMASRRETFYESQNGLNYLAEQTGGLAIRNTNDLSGGIQRILDDQRGYYLIGYRPDESTFEGKSGRRNLHHLSLKVTRPGKFEVRVRNGFFGEADEPTKTAEKTPAQQLLDGIKSPFGASDIHLQLTSLFANDATNGSYMRSLLHIDARDLTFKDAPGGLHEAVFDVVAMTFGDTSAVADYTGQTFTIQLPEEYYQRALRQGLVYNVTVPIKKAGAYQFRMALRDTATGHLGSASQYIEVPDLNNRRLALSGVVLSGSSNTAVQTNVKTDLMNPEASPAVRAFRQGMQMEWGYLIYNAQLDKNQKHQLTTNVRLFRTGQQVFSGGDKPFATDNQKDPQRLVVSGALVLGTDLIPGEYVLQIVVTDALADKKYRTVTQWMDFEIMK